jgi:hypothetical protein
MVFEEKHKIGPRREQVSLVIDHGMDELQRRQRFQGDSLAQETGRRLIQNVAKVFENEVALVGQIVQVGDFVFDIDLVDLFFCLFWHRLECVLFVAFVDVTEKLLQGSGSGVDNHCRLIGRRQAGTDLEQAQKQLSPDIHYVVLHQWRETLENSKLDVHGEVRRFQKAI